MLRKEKSVAESLRRAHMALLADLAKLQKAAQPSAGEALTELRAHLGATLTHITEHFRFEEQNGYLGAVRNREPRLDRAIEHLADEHRQLRQSLDELIEEASVASNLSDTLCSAIRVWIKRVQEHEARETDLVQNAFNLDVGEKD